MQIVLVFLHIKWHDIILKVLTDAKADCMLACKDDFAFGNLP